MRSQAPRQSASPMKPSSGVKPPMPSIRMSPRSRELTGTRGMLRARQPLLEQQRPQRRRSRQRLERRACRAGAPAAGLGFMRGRASAPVGHAALQKKKQTISVIVTGKTDQSPASRPWPRGCASTCASSRSSSPPRAPARHARRPTAWRARSRRPAPRCPSSKHTLGSPLFDRVGRRLVLNENGRVLLPLAASLLDQAAELEHLFTGASERTAAGGGEPDHRRVPAARRCWRAGRPRTRPVRCS